MFLAYIGKWMQNTVHKYKSSLGFQLIFSFSLVAMGFFLVIGIVVERSSWELNYQNYLNFIDEKCLSKSADFNARMQYYESNARFITANRYIVNLLQPGYYSDSETVEVMRSYIVPFIDSIKDIDDSIYKIRIFTDSKNVPESSGYFYDLSRITEDSWYKTFSQDPSGAYTVLWQAKYKSVRYDIEPLRMSSNEKYVMSLHTYIFDKQTFRVYGILEIQYDIEKLIHNLLTFDQETTGIIIINDIGDVLYRFNVDDMVMNELGYLNGSINKNAYTESNIIKAGRVGTYLVEPQQMDKLGCSFLYVFSTNALLKTQQLNRLLITLALILSIFAITFTTKLLNNRSLRNLRRLASFIKKIQEGEIDIAVPVESEDEVGRLAENINIMLQKIRNLIDYNIKCVTAEKESQIRMLQAQLDPHFLYNSLEEVRMFAETRGDEDIADAVGLLGQLMRYRISKITEQQVTILEEIKSVQGYMKLVDLLTNNHIELSIVIPPDETAEISGYHILKMMILSVVENAVKHGFKDRNRFYYIVVELKKIDNDIEIMIRNNGSHISKGKLKELNSRLEHVTKEDELLPGEIGIGLAYIQLLIKLNYGKLYGLTITSSVNETIVDIKVPIILSLKELPNGKNDTDS